MLELAVLGEGGGIEHVSPTRAIRFQPRKPLPDANSPVNDSLHCVRMANCQLISAGLRQLNQPGLVPSEE